MGEYKSQKKPAPAQHELQNGYVLEQGFLTSPEAPAQLANPFMKPKKE